MITVRINEKISSRAGPALEISARWSRPAWLLPVLMNRLLTTDPYITGSSFPYTFPMSRAVKIIGSHSYHLTTRLSSTFCGFEMVVPKQWWFQDFPYLWASIPRQVDLVKSDQSDDTSGGSGGMLPGKIFEFRVSEMAFPAL